MQRAVFRFTLATRLAIGFAAIAVVLLIGNWAAERSTQYAIETLRVTQEARMPFARAAGAISEQVIGYDRAVLDELREDSEVTRTASNIAATSLLGAADTYLAQRPSDTIDADALVAEIRTHVELGRTLTSQGRERQQMLARHRGALDDLGRQVTTTFRANSQLAERGVSRSSFADLEVSLGGMREAFNGYLVTGGDEAATKLERSQNAFRNTLSRHRDEFSRSPGRAWVELIDEDFGTMSQARRRVALLDAQIGNTRKAFGASGDALVGALDTRIAAPAQLAVTDSASVAAAATRSAERTFRMLTIAVLGVTLLASLLTTLAVTGPVRRLIRASRSLARGAWHTRVPVDGPRELAELAGAFNQMAQHLSVAHEEVERHRGELEDRVRARTRKLNFLAHHDSLTGLPNRRYGFNHLRRLVRHAQSHDGPIALLAIDVDNFKVINDNLGHSVGDQLLRAIAERLRTIVGERHFLARLGGDEFIVVMDRLHDASEPERVASNIVAAFHKPLRISDRDVLISISVGLSAFPNQAKDAPALMRAADAALFHAKALGRNRIALFTPQLLEGSELRFGLEQALRRAIETNELALVYQPQVDLETGETSMFEALLRWRRADGSMVPPSEFIAIAEQSGLIIQLGDWVLETATAAVAQWRADGLSTARVAINVSTHQLLDNGFVDRVAAALRRHDVPASALELELTETAFQTGTATIEALRKARDLGIAIALDDFGTGYSSLTSLSRLPLSRVKIDRSLIADIGHNNRAAAIARSIIAVCHSLGLEVTVEGVERHEQLVFLAHRGGAVAIQGHVLSYPLPSSEIQAFARTSTRHLADVFAAAPADSQTAGANADGVILFRPGTAGSRRPGS